MTSESELRRGRGTAVIVSAASGTGKSSLARALAGIEERVELSVSHTSRDRRPGEVDGKDYHFISKAEFEDLIRFGAFVEYAEVFGHYYGTSHRAIANRLDEGANVLLDIDWQGARQVRSLIEPVVSVFLLPPSLESLEQRLRERGRDNPDVIERRMSDAVSEMEHCFEFDCIIVNDVFEKALTDLNHVVQGFTDRVRPIPPNLLETLKIQASDRKH